MTRRRSTKRARPLSKGYRATAAVKSIRWLQRHTQKREAIRASHRQLRKLGAGAKAEVRTLEGALLYQAHARNLGGGLVGIVAEEL